MLIKNDEMFFYFPDEIEKPIKVVFPDVNSCPIDYSTLCEYSKLQWDDMSLCLFCELKERNKTNCKVIQRNKY